MGALPAVIAKRRFGEPFMTTHGYWYGRLAGERRAPLRHRGARGPGRRWRIVTTPELAAYVAARVGGAKVPR